MRAHIERVADSLVNSPALMRTNFIPSELVNDSPVGIGTATATEASIHTAAAIKLSPMIF
ncbi:MAG: hypothetical protein ACYSUC_09545 [Planctomycetota bacterium]